MWLMTPRGFYSAVQKRGDAPTRLTVRARDKQDLENLKDLLPNAKPYRKRGYSDYPWRINVSVAEWAEVCAQLALEVTYDNFKDEVKRVQGSERAAVYSRVWSALLNIEKRWNRLGGYGGYGSLVDDEDRYEEWWERTLATDLTQPGATLDARQRLDEQARIRREQDRRQMVSSKPATSRPRNRKAGTKINPKTRSGR